MNDVLLCTTKDGNGRVYIGLSVKDRQCAMTLDGALILFEKLGDMLVELGVIEEDYDKEDDEVIKCH